MRVPGMLVSRRGMAGTRIKTHKLRKLTIAINQQMRGYPKSVKASKVRMARDVELIEKKFFNERPAKDPGRQADRVNNHQFNVSIGWAFVLVWGNTLPAVLQPTT